MTADNSGNTPLHYASKGGHTELAKMLVGQGAVVEKRNAMRLTAYEVATDHVIRQFLLPLQLKVSERFRVTEVVRPVYSYMICCCMTV